MKCCEVSCLESYMRLRCIVKIYVEKVNWWVLKFCFNLFEGFEGIYLRFFFDNICLSVNSRFILDVDKIS